MTSNAPHQRFTVESTNYLRNLDREDIAADQIAVLYQDPPRETATGTSLSLRIPALLLTLYVENRQEIAEKVARILNAHWDDEDTAPADQPEPLCADCGRPATDHLSTGSCTRFSAEVAA